MTTDALIKQITLKTSNPKDIEKAIVYIFSKENGIHFDKSKILTEYFKTENVPLFDTLFESCFKDKCSITIENLVEFFELQISETTRKRKGAVFTPIEIRDYIITNTLLDSKTPQTVIDPSCGCGAFLLTATQKLATVFSLSYSEIINNYIFGIDINPVAIKQAELLLTLLATSNNDYNELRFNLFCRDTLNPETLTEFLVLKPNGFGMVLGNPPYVRYKNIEQQEKEFLGKWNSSAIGNCDLFVPFFEIGDKLLSNNGKLGYISPNSFIQGKNCAELRKYLATSNNFIKIIDFRDYQVFKNVTCYTAITLMSKQNTSNGIFYYARALNFLSMNNSVFTKYTFSDFPKGIPWRLRDSETDENIHKIESAGTKLGNWKIRNGLATLKNDVFFFTANKEDSVYYYRVFNGVEYPIEKSICIKVVKPNIIKNESDLKSRIEFAIFPYVKDGEKYDVLQESILKSEFPQAYSFLLKHKSLLLARDKGSGKYPTWYSYGRTQGLTNFGKKLLIPYISGKPTAVLSLDENLLFYCGYALFSEDEEELRLLKKFLESRVFWYYIYNTSKPYSKGYMAFAKNYIVNFGIPTLTNSEKKFLLACDSQKKADAFICKKYNINGDAKGIIP